MENPIQAYQALVQRVDAFFARAKEKYPENMHCEQGCDVCCHRDLSFHPFESVRMVEAVAALDPETRKGIVARARQASLDDEAPCPMLEGGGCLVYESRPVLCRSHGLPLLVPGSGELSVCPLNFTSIAHIDGDCVLDLTPVNQILTTINSLIAKQKQTSPERVLVSRAILDAFGEEVPR